MLTRETGHLTKECSWGPVVLNFIMHMSQDTVVILTAKRIMTFEI